MTEIVRLNNYTSIKYSIRISVFIYKLSNEKLLKYSLYFCITSNLHHFEKEKFKGCLERINLEKIGKDEINLLFVLLEKNEILKIVLKFMKFHNKQFFFKKKFFKYFLKIFMHRWIFWLKESLGSSTNVWILQKFYFF
jgi:hypothetical protein